MPIYDADRAGAREDLCRFLAACYYQLGPEFAEEMVFDSMFNAAIRIDPELAGFARQLGERFRAEGIDDLLLDYTRLFLGPNEAVALPYGSVWLERDRTLMGDSTMAVQALYAQGGFDIDEAFRELPDHVAAELEFLYLLIFRENEARREGNADALKTKAALRKRFLDEHLGRWIEPFAAAVIAGAQSGFYRALAGFTARFVRMEAESDQAD